MRKRYLTRSLVLVLALTALTAGGCCSWTRGRIYPTIRLSSDLREQSVELHLAGIRQSEHPMWQSYSVTEYFAPDNPIRHSAVKLGYSHVVRLGGGRMPAVQHGITLDQQQWEATYRQWRSRGARQMFILADLSQVDDVPGSADPRRVILPLNWCRYPSTQPWTDGFLAYFSSIVPFWTHVGRIDLEVEVTRGGVLVSPEPLPKH